MDETIFSYEKLPTRWPLVDIRRAMLMSRRQEALHLCCNQGHTYSVFVTDIHDYKRNPGERVKAIAALQQRARDQAGWLWWIRERLFDMEAAGNEVHLLPELRPNEPMVTVDENDIGWPGARASSGLDNSSITVTYGTIGGGHGVTMDVHIDQWTTIRQDLTREQAVAAQAFCACVRHTAIVCGMNNAWRQSIYSVVEWMCTRKRNGNSVFHPDEELTWEMFMRKRWK